jgi:hypothetical protein
MKKILLFWTFFVLTLFVNGQDKVGHGNDSEGCDSSGIGLVTTWVKPSGYWNYEGVMTVGYEFDGDYSYYGYITDRLGSLIPSLAIEGEIDLVYVPDGMYVPEGGVLFISPFSNLEEVQIDGVSYLPPYDVMDNPNFQIYPGSNPFPAVGETCDIKLKYTLTP